MEEQIKNYKNFINQEIQTLKTELSHGTKNPDKQKLRDHVINLNRFHSQRLADIQQERLAHLFVTIFFAVLFLTFFFVFVLVLPRLKIAAGNNLPIVLFAVLTIIILIVEIFYLKHYYFLENNLQKLYLTEYELLTLLEQISVIETDSRHLRQNG